MSKITIYRLEQFNSLLHDNITLVCQSEYLLEVNYKLTFSVH